MDAQLNQELMIMANFYGTIASTPELDKKIKEKCQLQLARLLDSLDRATNHLIEANSALTIVR